LKEQNYAVLKINSHRIRSDRQNQWIKWATVYSIYI